MKYHSHAFGGGVDAAPQRNLTRELNQTLAGYQQTAPGFLALNKEFQPAYTRLGLDTLTTQQQGYTDESGVYHPGTTQLNQEATTSNRASSLADLLGFGPTATGALFNANPFLGNSTVNSSNLLDELSKEASAGLATGGKLTPEEEYNASQATQAGFASRGMNNSNSSLVTDVLNRDALTRGRQQAAQSFASGVAGQNLQASDVFSRTVTNPIWQLLGFGNLNPGYSGGSSPTTSAVSTANDLFPQQSPYLQDIYSSNQNATASNNIANANNSAATTGAILGLIGSIFSDERIKTKIKKTGRKTPEGLDEIEWTYKHDPKKRRFRGVSAQQVERKTPWALRVDPFSGLKAVDYGQLRGVSMQQILQEA